MVVGITGRMVGRRNEPSLGGRAHTLFFFHCCNRTKMPLCPFSAMKSAVLGVRSQAVLHCVVPQATGRAVSDGRCWLWPGSCAHNRRSENVAFDCAPVPPPRSLSLRPRLVRCLSRRRAPASVAVLCAPAPPPRSLSCAPPRPRLGLFLVRRCAPASVSLSRAAAPPPRLLSCAPPRPRLGRCLVRPCAPASVSFFAPPPSALFAHPRPCHHCVAQSRPHRRPLFSRTRAPATVVSRNRAPTAVRSFRAPAHHFTLSKQRTACARARCEVRGANASASATTTTQQQERQHNNNKQRVQRARNTSPPLNAIIIIYY